MMLPNPADLKYFLEVASTHKISRAAERLGISQPSLSVAIQRLEACVGAPLLIRAKSGVELTKAGSKLAARAKNLLSEWEQLRNEALESRSQVAGRYTLGCHPSVALYTLPLFLPELLSENSDLEITLHHDLSRKITEDVISYKIDFGIVVNPVQHPDLVIRPLIRDDVTFWRSSNTENNDTLIYDPELRQSQELLRKLSAMEKKSTGKNQFARTIHSSNLEVIASLVECGAGIGILPTRVAQLNPQSKLKKAFATSPPFRDIICLVSRVDTARASAASKMILDFIQKNVGSEK